MLYHILKVIIRERFITRSCRQVQEFYKIETKPIPQNDYKMKYGVWI